eukprot:386723-Pelagomonas_calceolata.AAC.8
MALIKRLHHCVGVTCAGAAQLKRAADCVEDCVALVDVSQPGWRIMYVNAVWDKIMGEPPKLACMWSLYRWKAC